MAETEIGTVHTWAEGRTEDKALPLGRSQGRGLGAWQDLVVG